MTPLDQAFEEADQHLVPQISEAVMAWLNEGHRTPMSITIALLKGSYAAIAMHQNSGPELRQQAFSELSAAIAVLLESRFQEFVHPADNVVNLENWKAFKALKDPLPR